MPFVEILHGKGSFLDAKASANLATHIARLFSVDSSESNVCHQVHGLVENESHSMNDWEHNNVETEWDFSLDSSGTELHAVEASEPITGDKLNWSLNTRKFETQEHDRRDDRPKARVWIPG